MLQVSQFIQILVQGFLLGCVYLLIALGLNIAFGVAKVVNFAHGAFVMLGAYAAYWIFKFLGLTPYVSLLLVGVTIPLLGMIPYLVNIEPFFGMTNFDALALIATYGYSLLFVNLVRLAWTDVLRTVDLALRPIVLGPITVSRTYLYGGLLSLSVSILFYLLLTRTMIGTAIRATSESWEIAMLLGINPKRISRVVFFLGVALAAVAGALLSTIFAINPEMGGHMTMLAFTIITLGGLGNNKGAVIGSFILSYSELLGSFFLGAKYQPMIFFGVLFFTLVLKPSGIAGVEV